MDASNPRPLRVLQISDPHLFEHREQKLLNVDTDASLRGVIRYVNEHEQDVDIVLATGDISQDGSAPSYQRFLDLVRPVAPLLRGLPGNHDSNHVLYETWGEHAQAITDIGHWRLVMLDSTIAESNAGHIRSDELDLLREAAATAGERHVLVGIHHNPIPIGSRWLDTMMIDNGYELLAVLKSFASVRGLIWGHVHQEFDSVYSFGATESGKQRDLRLLAAPATCVQVTPRSVAFSLDTADPGYRWLELYDDGRIESGVMRVPGLGIQPDTGSAGY